MTLRGNRNRREQDSRLPLPGALLTRKWKGRNLLVEVLANGFRYASTDSGRLGRNIAWLTAALVLIGRQCIGDSDGMAVSFVVVATPLD
jgi:hypothetical protein